MTLCWMRAGRARAPTVVGSASRKTGKQRIAHGCAVEHSLKLRGLKSFVQAQAVVCDQQETPRQLAFDGDALVYFLSRSSDLPWEFGGEYLRLAERTEAFVLPFLQCNSELVFFFDGALPLAKRAEWLARKNQDIRDLKLAWQRMTSSRAPTSNKLPALARDLVAATLGRLATSYPNQVRTFECPEEADNEMASFCAEHKFTAVSSDSDFFIFHNIPGYIPFSTLSGLESRPRGRIFTQEAIDSYLSVPRPLRALLAVVAGNDRTSSLSELRALHACLSLSTLAPIAIVKEVSVA